MNICYIYRFITILKYSDNCSIYVIYNRWYYVSYFFINYIFINNINYLYQFTTHAITYIVNQRKYVSYLFIIHIVIIINYDL